MKKSTLFIIITVILAMLCMGCKDQTSTMPDDFTYEITGTVIDESGQGMENADVALYRTGDQVKQGKTGFDGRYSFPGMAQTANNDYQVTAGLAGFEPEESAKFPLAGDYLVPAITLKKTPAYEIRGTVKLDTSVPDITAIDVRLCRNGIQKDWLVHPDLNGEYCFSGIIQIKTEDYYVEATLKDFYTKKSDRFDLGNDYEVEELTLTRESYTINGKITTDPAGTDLHAVTVKLYRTTAGAEKEWAEHPDKNGNYSFADIRKVENDEYYVAAELEGFEWKLSGKLSMDNLCTITGVQELTLKKAPRLIKAYFFGERILSLRFDGPVDVTSKSNATGFKLTSTSQTPLVAQSIKYDSRDELQITTDRDVAENETITVEYAGSSKLIKEDKTNYFVSSFAKEVPGKRQMEVVGIMPAKNIKYDKLLVLWSKNVNSSTMTSAGWTIEGLSLIKIDSINVYTDAPQVIFVLSRELIKDEIITLSYDPDKGNKVESTDHDMLPKCSITQKMSL